MTDSGLARIWAWSRADLRRFDVAVAVATALTGSLLALGAPERFDTGWPELAAGVGAFVLVLLRRWHPLVLLAVALVWTAAHIGIYQRPTPTIFAVIVLVATACVRLDRWRAIGLGVAIAASLYVLGLISNDAELGDARAVIGIAWTAMAVGIADAVRTWRSYRDTVQAQLRATVAAAEAQTRQQVSEERLAIARELHDLLAHNLSVMNVQTGAALHLVRADPDQAEASLTAARDAGKTVLSELRDLLAVLRHDEDDDQPTSSLPTFDDLPRLVETMRNSGLDVSWRRVGGPSDLTPAVSLAAYRVAQESLTNAARHGTAVVEFVTEWRDGGVGLRIVNDLPAVADDAAAVGSGLGIVGMRERATANGGSFTAGPDGGRFVVEAWFPAAAVDALEPR